MRNLFFILLLLACIPSLHSQDKDAERTKPPAPQNYFTTIPIRDILRDCNIGYARHIGFTHSLEVRGGWVHPNKFLSRYYDRYLNSSEMLFQGASLYLQMNKWKVNPKNGKRTFEGVILGYRYMWYEDKNLTVFDEEGNHEEKLTLSQWRNDFFLLGTYGAQTSNFSLFEVSVGVRMVATYTNVSNTAHYSTTMQDTYDEYVKTILKDVPYSSGGLGFMPIVRVSSRIGKFSW